MEVIGEQIWEIYLIVEWVRLFFLMENRWNSCVVVRHVEHHVFLCNDTQKPSIKKER